MKRIRVYAVFFALGAAAVLPTASCVKNDAAPQNSETAKSMVEAAAQTSMVGGASKGEVLATDRLDLDFSKHLVTFIEIGADKCIPCKAMQPIMKDIAASFPDKVQVVFYDVWKNPEPGRHYKIQLIPTQVFVGQDGKEFFRHVGFFAKEEILKLLKDKGVS
jgi:thioredoxin 1